MAKTAKTKAKSKAVKKPLLPFEMGTIESDDEVPASESDASGDEAEDAENAAGGESDGASSRGGFIFDDESAFGGTLGKSYGASAGPSWDFTAAMKVLADQGAKKPFVLLTEEHIAKQRDVARKRIAKDRQDARKKRTSEGAANGEAGEEEAEVEGSDDDEEIGEDENDANSDDADESDEDGVSDEEDSEDEFGPEVEDEVRALGITPAEAAAKIRADKKRLRDEANEDGNENEDEDNEEEEEVEEEKEEERASSSARKSKAGDDDENEGQRRGATVDDDSAAAAFFDTNSSFLEAGSGGGSSNQDVYFSQLNLSRPLIRGVEAMGFVKPTPIQARVVPVALAGRDVCGSAVTGSGKTAAFLLPVLERLLYRPSGVAATRVLIVAPTRELAAQCHAMGSALARFVDPPIEFSLITGGTKNLRPQEAELRKRPDIVICTPGRMLDHVRNSQVFNLLAIQILK